MNKVILLGRLTKDPEVRYTAGTNTTAVCRYTLAVNRQYKREGEPDADFFNCVTFGNRAEFSGKYLHKGSMIAVVGELRNNSYTDRNGTKRYSTDIVVSEVHFAGSNNQSSGNMATPNNADFAPADAGYQAPAQRQSTQRQTGTPAPQSDEFMPVDEDFSNEDLPF